MTAVNYSNITSLPNDTVYTIVNTRANIVDPRDATGARKFVYDSDPFGKAIDFSSFPYIIVDLPIIEPVQSSSNNEHKMMEYTQVITVRTAKDGSAGTRTDAGHSDMQQINDDMFQTFNATTTKATLRAAWLFNSELRIIASNNTQTINQKNIFETVFEFSANWRMKVIA